MHNAGITNHQEIALYLKGKGFSDPSRARSLVDHLRRKYPTPKGMTMGQWMQELEGIVDEHFNPKAKPEPKPEEPKPEPKPDDISLFKGPFNTPKSFDKMLRVSKVGRNSAEVSQIRAEWKRVPARYTENLDWVRISNEGNTYSGGKHVWSYDGKRHKQRVLVRTGIGKEFVFHHEMHHHMWRNVRTEEEKREWAVGIDRILIKRGLSPTNYPGHDYGPNKRMIENIKTHVKELEDYEAKIAQGNLKYEDTPNHEYYTKDLAEVERRIKEVEQLLKTEKDAEMVKHYKKDVEHYTEVLELHKMRHAEERERYNNASDEEKMKSFKVELESLKGRLGDFQDIYYNECHSEVGGYLMAEAQMRKRNNDGYDSRDPSWDHRINEAEMKEAVELYRKVFKT